MAKSVGKKVRGGGSGVKAKSPATPSADPPLNSLTKKASAVKKSKRSTSTKKGATSPMTISIDSSHTPSELQATLINAEKLHLKGQLQEAWALYQEILRQEPSHYAAIHGMGLIAAQMRSYSMAIDLFNNAIAVDKSNPRAYSNLANALASEGKKTLALKNYDTAIKLDAGYVDAIKNRGLVRAELKQYKESLADFARVLELAPGYWRAHIYTANVLISMGRLDKALHAYDLGLAANPNSAALCNNLGAILCSMGRFKTALPKLDRAIKINPQYAEAFNNRAVALIGLQRPGEALKNYDQALVIKPAYQDAMMGKAKLQASMSA
jgi:tetratricopeptide (TPR) repeat protein